MRNEPHIIAHLQQDPLLRSVLAHIELPDTNPTYDVFGDLLVAVISQQVSVKSAQAVYKRFAALFPDSRPTAKGIVEKDIDALRQAGLTRQKASYVKNVATFFLTHPLSRNDWQRLSDEEVIGLLTPIKGVGVWTVQMILMFSLDRPDVLPLADIGIQNTMKKIYGITAVGKELLQQMTDLAAPWRPYRTYACRALWKWKDGADWY